MLVEVRAGGNGEAHVRNPMKENVRLVHERSCLGVRAADRGLPEGATEVDASRSVWVHISISGRPGIRPQKNVHICRGHLRICARSRASAVVIKVVEPCVVDLRVVVADLDPICVRVRAEPGAEAL